MSVERHARVKAIFAEALETDEGERAAWVKARCADEPDVAGEVLSLLGFHDDGPLMDVPEVPADPKDPIGLSGQTIDGRYRVERLVDEGGFGYVYAARQLQWDKPVAIKVFKHLDGVSSEKLEQAFLTEGALLNELSRRTTAIVRSFDVGTWTSKRRTPYLFTVLEWLEGESLGDRLRREHVLNDGPWSLDEVIEVLAPIAEALAVAHDNGVAHRDLKPSNIYLVKEGGRATAKLLDFGVAKVAGTHGFARTGFGVAAMSTSYGAPEQIDKSFGTTGPWTDVFALALLIVELLIGKPALPTDSPRKAIESARDPERRPTPRMSGVELGDGVEAVLTRALAVKAADRYETADDFWKALLREAKAQPSSGSARSTSPHWPSLIAAAAAGAAAMWVVQRLLGG